MRIQACYAMLKHAPKSQTATRRVPVRIEEVFVLDEEIEIDLASLDSAPTGDEYSRSDGVLLAILGIALPAVLLVLGAM